MFLKTIDNLSIRRLLTVPVSVLALMLIGAMIWETTFVYQPRSEQATRLRIANAMADHLLALAASAAQERGFTAGYLSKLQTGQRAPDLLSAIERQRRRGDAALEAALGEGERFARATGADLDAQRRSLQGAHEEVRRLRAAVDSAETDSIPDPTVWFRTMTGYIFAASDLRLAAFRPTDQTGITEYSNNMIKQALWLAAEYAGRERAMVGQLLAGGRPMDAAVRSRLTEYRNLVEDKLAFVGAIANPVLLDNPASPELAHRLRDAWQAVQGDFLGSFQTFRRQVYEAAASGDYPVDAQTWLTRSTAAIDTLFAFSDVIGRDAVLRTQAANRAAVRSLWGAGTMTLASVLMAIVALGLITAVVRRLHALTDTITRVQDENDLSLRVEERGRNELAEVGRAFNSMLRRFAEIVGGVTRATSAVTEKVAELVAAAEHTNRGVQHQNTAIDQVATAMEEMAATVKEVAGNTVRAAEAADGAADKARDGNRVVAKSLDAIEGMEGEVEQIATRIAQLRADSLEIGQVTDVITGIAEQTNLLALNAAIEAARAGEQGRGFAVVADEVRGLAGRTQESTGTIRATIERLQARAGDAVRAMNGGRDRARATVESTAGVGAALETIVATVDDISHMNSQIAAAAEEQTQVAEDINRNVANIAAVTEQTTRAAGDTVRAGEAISDEMERLRQIVIRFKTGERTLDLTAAKTAHLAWKSRLGAYLKGQGSLTLDQAVSHHDCVLGQWYYGDGLAQFGHVPPMKALERPHAELHGLIREIIRLREAGRMDEAQQAYARVEPLSRRIVELLEAIENEVART